MEMAAKKSLTVILWITFTFWVLYYLVWSLPETFLPWTAMYISALRFAGSVILLKDKLA